MSSNAAGFTANANKAKGRSQETATTHTNTQITAFGTTYNDIGGNLILDGANLSADYLTGKVGKDLIVNSRQDIHNHLNYEGDAVSLGAGLGANNKGQDSEGNQNKTSYNASPQGLGYGSIDRVNQTFTTHSAITDQAGLSHINTENFNQQEVQDELNQIIANDFDKERVLKELNAQVTITQAFDTERRAIRTEYAKKAEDYRKQAEELPQGSQERTELETKAKQIDDNLRIFDSITSALYAPNSNGIIGDVARAVSPQVAYQIGQYFKQNNTEQSASHLLAHAILGVVVIYATGNDITTGAISGAANEAVAPVLSNYLYGTTDPETLSQEQKDIIVSILT